MKSASSDLTLIDTRFAMSYSSCLHMICVICCSHVQPISAAFLWYSTITGPQADNLPRFPLMVSSESCTHILYSAQMRRQHVRVNMMLVRKDRLPEENLQYKEVVQRARQQKLYHNCVAAKYDIQRQDSLYGHCDGQPIWYWASGQLIFHPTSNNTAMQPTSW